jgi:hypothetical protein
MSVHEMYRFSLQAMFDQAEQARQELLKQSPIPIIKDDGTVILPLTEKQDDREEILFEREFGSNDERIIFQEKPNLTL